MSTESDTLGYLFEEEPSEEEDKQEDIPFLEGICPKCLDSGFVHTTKDGVLGIAFRLEGQDSGGQPIKRLISCNHGIKVNY